ncbi:uncharacterized protein [Henckelia pumila]|uniref:uncharacterized protein n=1 Tax=Henckelia pumila TaxID=405737 RepID=UPI003C6DE875
MSGRGRGRGKGRGRGGGVGNVADMTVDQLSQFITQTVLAAMGQNQQPLPPPPPGDEELPANFKQPTLGEYDGSSDPEEHLGRFENAALLHRYSDAIKCRVFLTTLVRLAQQWFNLLQPGSIRSFNDFSLAFLYQYASSKKYLKTSLSLFNLKQSEVEPLREYVQRFNTATLEVPAATADTLVNSFTQGLRGGEFFKSLVKKPPLTYDELLSRDEKYVNLEDARRQRRHEGTSESKSSNKSEYRHVTNDCQRLGEEVQRIMYEDPRIRAELTRRANPPRQGRASQWRNKGNEDRGNYVDHQGRAPQNGREERVEKTANHPHRGVIHMISGGTTDGDSGRDRKAHGRRLKNFEVNFQFSSPVDPNISFGSEDLKDVVVPHNDPLLVTLTITNYDMARIFVDTGSSVNIIFKKTLDQMKLEGFELDPITTVFYGFTGHALQPLGQIVLSLSLGGGGGTTSH